jgi:hypothetical protein
MVMEQQSTPNGKDLIQAKLKELSKGLKEDGEIPEYKEIDGLVTALMKLAQKEMKLTLKQKYDK